MLDLPGFTKFEVTGPGAATWIDHMVTGALPKPGRTALNYFCAPSGGIVTEMTITAFGPNHYWLILAAAGESHDEHWLREHLPADGSVQINNLSARYGTLIVVGLLTRYAALALSGTTLPDATARIGAALTGPAPRSGDHASAPVYRRRVVHGARTPRAPQQ